MKGIIFNLLEHFIASRYGEEVYHKIIVSSNIDELDPFEIVGPGSYPDTAFNSILQKASENISITIPELLHEMGRHSLPILAGRYPHFFEACDHPKDFLKTASMIHHVEVRKLYQDTEVPNFSVDEMNPKGFMLTYKSKRLLCYLAAGLIVGLGDYYKIPVTIEQAECTQAGDQVCKFIIKFQDEALSS